MPISLASNDTAPRIFSTSAASASSASGSPSAGCLLVKIGLQYELRSNLIANVLVRACFHAGIGQRFGGGMGGKAFVDQLRGESEAAFELVREASRPRGQSVLRAVGMQGQADDKQRRMPFVDKALDRGEAVLVLLAGDGCQRMRQSDGALAHRDPDAPGSEIERENGPRARSAAGCCLAHASRVPDGVGQSRKIDAQQLHRRGQARLCRLGK